MKMLSPLLNHTGTHTHLHILIPATRTHLPIPIPATYPQARDARLITYTHYFFVRKIYVSSTKTKYYYLFINNPHRDRRKAIVPNVEWRDCSRRKFISTRSNRFSFSFLKNVCILQVLTFLRRNTSSNIVLKP